MAAQIEFQSLSKFELMIVKHKHVVDWPGSALSSMTVSVKRIVVQTWNSRPKPYVHGKTHASSIVLV